MRKALLILGLVSFTCMLSAQQIHFQQEEEKPRRGYIGISLGASIPTGQFASSDYKEDYSGYAKTALSLQLINFGFTFGSNIGIAGMWTGNTFKVNEDALLNNLAVGGLSIEADPWSFGALMIGILISVPANKFNIDFRGMIGYAYTTAPEISISGYSDEGPFVLTQKSASSDAVAGDFGMGIRFHLSQLICLNLLFDYLACKPVFSSMLYSGEAGIYQPIQFEQPMNHFTITGGIGFKLK